MKTDNTISSEAYLCPPVLIIIFNRPDETSRIFQRVREAKPAKLFIAADGPRPNVPDESMRCEETRRVVADIDWPCEVHRRYSESNYGCRAGGIAAINWVFENVEQAIILEDDCLPHLSFFRFAGEILTRFKDEPSVLHISGSNFSPEACPVGVSYYFSRYAFCWGWATWRRAWKLYDPDMTAWPSLRLNDWLTTVLPGSGQAQYWKIRLDFIMEHERALTWDYQWLFTCWQNCGLCVSPGVNLVTNIGCGPRATNVVDTRDWRANLPSHPMGFPLDHPAQLEICQAADQIVFTRCILNKPSGIMHYLGEIRNRHFWGSVIRRIPIAGPAWAHWRKCRNCRNSDNQL